MNFLQIFSTCIKHQIYQRISVTFPLKMYVHRKCFIKILETLLMYTFPSEKDSATA